MYMVPEKYTLVYNPNGTREVYPGGVYQGVYMPPYCTRVGIPAVYLPTVPPWVHPMYPAVRHRYHGPA